MREYSQQQANVPAMSKKFPSSQIAVLANTVSKSESGWKGLEDSFASDNPMFTSASGPTESDKMTLVSAQTLLYAADSDSGGELFTAMLPPCIEAAGSSKAMDEDLVRILETAAGAGTGWYW
jgi:hypothetical protein